MENPDKIILYGSPVCLMVPPVYAVLKRTDAEFAYIDIYRDRAGREAVRRINQGYESVPTIAFPDGSTLTEPTPGQLTRKLRAMGYTVDLPLWRKAINKITARLRVGQS